jgi:hypothetical protein
LLIGTNSRTAGATVTTRAPVSRPRPRHRLFARPGILVRCCCMTALLSRGTALAQVLPSEPLVFGNGRVTIGGDISASYGSIDPGFFNYTDYEYSALRMVLIDLTAAVNAGDHFAFLGELRTENFGGVQPYAFYLRIRPWRDRSVDIQVGRVPPTFGAFPRRTYGTDNPLIGYPLTYQYLTSLRPDAVPANADELLAMRGRGWLANYSIGNPYRDRGVPLVTAFRWDTGVQVHIDHQWIEGTAAVTTGTVSNPVLSVNHSTKQLVGRLVFRPVPGLIIGTSAARGPFLTSSAVESALGPGHDNTFTQTAWGADLEYSRRYYLVRFETVVSSWTLPAIRPPFLDGPLRAIGTSVEGRYKVAPGLYVAGRVDHLGFNDITGTDIRESWDAPVTRVEAGGGYSLQRNLILKLSGQRDIRDGGRVPTATLFATQLVFWF